MTSDWTPADNEAHSASWFAWLMLAVLAAWVVIGAIVAAIF